MAAGKQRVVAVIPARYGSTRFPAKVLAKLQGKAIVQWVYERVSRAGLEETLVATDDQRVFDCVRSFGGQAVMTSPNHPTGTDRIAEAVRDVAADIVLNVQGDEPLIPPDVVRQLADGMRARPEVEMGTVAVPLDPDGPLFRDPNVVKVVVDRQDLALYFSRAPIPHARDTRPAAAQPLHHWGLYAFRRDFLQRFVSWPRGVLEACENLEQLRALENGARIWVLRGHRQTVGIDVPADLARAEALLASGQFEL